MFRAGSNYTDLSDGSSVAPHLSPTQFFDEAAAVFETACNSSDSVDQNLSLANSVVRLRFSTCQLQKLLGRSFEHLSCDSRRSPSLTINVWDDVTTGSTMPSPPWSNDDYLARGEIRGFNNERYRTAFILGETAGLNMLDLERDEAHFWVRDARAIPYYETGAPLRTILYWWLSAKGYQLVHGGAVGLPGGGVLLVGRGGSGKSTSCLACLGSKLQYIGDDYCVVTSSPRPYAFSLYSTAKLKGAADLKRFPDLVDHVSNVERLGEEKALFFLHDHFAESIVRGFPLRAILVPHVSAGSDAYVESVSPALGMAALAPSSIFQNAGAAHLEFKYLSDLVQSLPCYRLVVGEKITQIPSAIFRLLEDLEESNV